MILPFINNFLQKIFLTTRRLGWAPC